MKSTLTWTVQFLAVFLSASGVGCANSLIPIYPTVENENPLVRQDKEVEESTRACVALLQRKREEIRHDVRLKTALAIGGSIIAATGTVLSSVGGLHKNDAGQAEPQKGYVFAGAIVGGAGAVVAFVPSIIDDPGESKKSYDIRATHDEAFLSAATANPSEARKKYILAELRACRSESPSPTVGETPP